MLCSNTDGDATVFIVEAAGAVEILAEFTIGRNKSEMSEPISGCAEKYPDKHSLDG